MTFKSMMSVSKLLTAAVSGLPSKILLSTEANYYLYTEISEASENISFSYRRPSINY